MQKVDESKEIEDNSLKSFNDRYYRALYEIMLKVHLTKSTKLDEYFGLLFKSMKSDGSLARVMAFVKRLLQVCFLNETGYTAASLLIISELLRIKKDFRFHLFSFDSGAFEANDSDEEEHFFDADKLTDKKNQTQNAPKNSENQKIDYDPLKREPRFSKADKCPMFEICILANHSHPTVKLWAEKILKG